MTAPLLVIEGKSWRWAQRWRRAFLVAGSGGAFAVFGIATAVDDGRLSHLAVPELVRDDPRRLLLVYLVAAVLAWLALGTYVEALAKRVELHQEGVFFFPNKTRLPKWERAVSVGWRDLAGYRDGAAGSVRLVKRRGLGRWWRAELVVPTPTEEKRRRVLEILDAAKVPRLE